MYQGGTAKVGLGQNFPSPIGINRARKRRYSRLYICVHLTLFDRAIFESSRYSSGHSDFGRCISSQQLSSTKIAVCSTGVNIFDKNPPNLPQAVKFNCPFGALFSVNTTYFCLEQDSIFWKSNSQGALGQLLRFACNIFWFCFLCYVFWRWGQVQWTAGKQFWKLEKY